MRRLVELGVPRFIYTDIARDGTLRGPNLAATRPGRAGRPRPRHRLRRHRHPRPPAASLATIGVEGAILGRALYDGALTLPEALQVAVAA